LANAAVELPDKEHPARRVIEAFKTAAESASPRPESDRIAVRASDGAISSR
jgi:hypothetical protein